MRFGQECPHWANWHGGCIACRAMETTAYIALSRQVALHRRMEVIANNVANMTSSGFKAEALVFEPAWHRAGRDLRLAFVQDLGVARDLRAGPMIPTGNDLDLAIDGPGYFAVETAQGVRYGRGGQFRLNEFGELVTSAGDPVLDEGGAPLALPPDAGAISIAADGTVSTAQGVAGRIGLVEFAEEQRLHKVGGGLYDTDEPPLPAERSRVVPGMLEGSNVQPILEMTEMMTTVRAYQSTHRLLETHHELQRRTIERMLEVAG
ncbi:MAG TPA: flagellar basal-body rod protein FlgF [Geminicoccaceae bacterium]|nr:flagellar basal-body rod protein FlgF [Geminicoccaceae bacterium]